MSGDAYFSDVALLLHADGANAATTFPDTSPLANALTALGTAQLSTAQFKFGSASLYLDGTANCYAKAATAANFDIENGDHTVEMFHYTPSLPPSGQVWPLFSVSQNNSGGFLYWHLSLADSGRLYCAVNSSTSSSLATSSGTVLASTWQHLAFTRQGNTGRLFIDGVLSATNTSWVNYATAQVLNAALGALANGYTDTSYKFYAGYLDEIRVTKGVARYTASFTPPAAPFPDGAGQIAGVIKDSTGTPCARIVRAYRRDTGAKVADVTSDATTGAYSFYLPTLDEVSLLALDNATTGTIYNDLIDRVIPA